MDFPRTNGVLGLGNVIRSDMINLHASKKAVGGVRGTNVFFVCDG